MNSFQLKIQTDRRQGLKYQIFSEESVNEQGINSANKILKNKNYDKWQKKQNQFKKLADTYGWRLVLVEPYIKEIIKTNEKKNSTQMDLNLEKAKRIIKQKKLEIDEEDGVRLALLFKTVSQIRKMRKIDKILLNIKSMSREEAYYWYSKVFTNRRKQTGVRSLRILIGS